MHFGKWKQISWSILQNYVDQDFTHRFYGKGTVWHLPVHKSTWHDDRTVVTTYRKEIKLPEKLTKISHPGLTKLVIKKKKINK